MDLREMAHLLDALEEALALLFDEGLAQQIAEEMDLVREGVCHEGCASG